MLDDGVGRYLYLAYDSVVTQKSSKNLDLQTQEPGNPDILPIGSRSLQFFMHVCTWMECTQDSALY
jgi:G:T-mismatch repair DNA endonuclease (very short patch repair protein)